MRAQKALQAILFSAVVIVAGLFLIFYGIPTQITNEQSWTGDAILNARTMPYFATAVLLVSAALELVTNTYRYLKLKGHEEKEAPPVNWRAECKAVLMFGLCLLYALLFSKTNYLISSAICPPLALVILGDRNWRHYGAIYAVVGAMYFIFRFALGVMI